MTAPRERNDENATRKRSPDLADRDSAGRPAQYVSPTKRDNSLSEAPCLGSMVLLFGW